jgi:hypothetical protein
LRIETFSDIRRITDQKMREGNGVYFWSPSVIKKDDRTLLRLARDISAVANAEGGVIIIGIKSYRGRANSIEYIKIDININWLIHEIQSRISRRIKDLTINSITETEGQVLIIKIPENNNSPHMCEDGKYYYWSGKKAVVMEETRVRYMYKATSSPELEFVGLYGTNGVPVLKDGAIERVSFYPKLIVQNRGGQVEKDYKVELTIPAELHDTNFHPLQTNLVRHEGGDMVFSIPGRNPLFQDEISAPFELKLVVNAENFEVFEQSNLQIRIYYSKGVHTHSLNISDSLRYNGRKLCIKDFLPKQSLEN